MDERLKRLVRLFELGDVNEAEYLSKKADLLIEITSPEEQPSSVTINGSHTNSRTGYPESSSSTSRNISNVPIRMGYEDEVRKIQDLYLEGHKEEAAAAVPTYPLWGSKRYAPSTAMCEMVASPAGFPNTAPASPTKAAPAPFNAA